MLGTSARRVPLAWFSTPKVLSPELPELRDDRASRRELLRRGKAPRVRCPLDARGIEWYSARLASEPIHRRTASARSRVWRACHARWFDGQLVDLSARTRSPSLGGRRADRRLRFGGIAARHATLRSRHRHRHRWVARALG